jgi:hypothetical protein
VTHARTLTEPAAWPRDLCAAYVAAMASVGSPARLKSAIRCSDCLPASSSVLAEEREHFPCGRLRLPSTGL